MRRHGKKAAFVVAALAIVAAAVAGWRLVGGAPVDVVAVQRREIVQRVVATGRVLPLARISVGSLVSGAVTKVRVDEGTRVAEG
ncbi:MAG TPA: efflux RND transporter periplasmic adaptor subunit, partial [bacterium]|nr:efflux RND transporter periplasmic adaptor subunit [bacterium]